ncbi:MAG: hypothetical protein QGH45_16455 [Myxococcota bacterium]|nr:hypothetical protein [Myxococcota bacterium]
MLDAYIIQKIKQEREVESARPALHIEIPAEPEPPRVRDGEREDEDQRDRGVTIVDYSI